MYDCSLDKVICDNCGKMKMSHRQVSGLLLCYPDTFPDNKDVFIPIFDAVVGNYV